MTSASTPAAPTRELDCLGKACPVPVIELARTVGGMALGECVVVVADDAGAKVDIPVWCRMKRQELVAVEDTEGVFRFTVRRVS